MCSTTRGRFGLDLRIRVGFCGAPSEALFFRLTKRSTRPVAAISESQPTP
jgi:hypothetical protein